MKYSRIACVADRTEKAQAALKLLNARYRFHPDVKDADVVIALGGDGFMLHTLHATLTRRVPIYGMNCGSVGFLMNRFEPDQLMERLDEATRTVLYPLAMTATSLDGKTHEALAINEVSLLRETHQAAKLRICVDDRVRMEELICDGMLIATPAGSTAYNFSAGGPIIPLDAQLLTLTPLSAFRPRRWRGALLPQTALVTLDILDPDKRPVSVTADFTEFREVVKVTIRENRESHLTLLFDAGHSLEDRIISEQFMTS